MAASPTLMPFRMRTPPRWAAVLTSVAAVAGGITVVLAAGVLGGVTFAASLLALLFGGAASAAVLLARSGRDTGPVEIDWVMLGAALADGGDAAAVTDRDGRLRCVSPAWRELFGDGASPATLPTDPRDRQRLADAMRAALRDGSADVGDLVLDHRPQRALLRRAGRRDDHVVWRFRREGPRDTYGLARTILSGDAGTRMGEAGVMMALADPDGRLVMANQVFAYRALGDASADPAGLDLVSLLRADDDGAMRLAREAEASAPLRIISIPVGDAPNDGATVFLLIDEHPDATSLVTARAAATVHLHGLLAMLPLGLALIERDGRFLYLNEAFARAAGMAADESAMYPSDLVIDEDKPVVIDAIRRFAAGRALPGDLPIRLRRRPDESVPLTIANAKGLGDAAVLLSLKDDSEQSTLKRQVAQATKMQAVGQLAGGVAHDFNNILTAIIGHCDLMMMRHTPGDIDYDDIQQIRNNSNRAAALTRQLLAFSRQQTLRPQILQLPDIISEVSNLLRRLLGETVKLEVKHGRNLGLVRADPGQLEQVIVNLAVNARDAMPGGGLLTLQTLSVGAGEVRRMQSEILPVADYTALRVTDTGCGIPPQIIGKIFEPFFTTKEVGVGTGLGLSTVYGIVKQTDGFIFAESEEGKGTSFIIYLPVHHAAAAPDPTPPVRIEPAGDVWGTGTILLVEDEAMVRAVAERALVRQGYRVLTATNGEEALEVLEEQGAEIDLLISDVVMPMMDGPALVKEARARFPALPVLFMSGYAEEQLRNSIDIRQVAFLTKPFSVQQLAHAARDAMAAE